MVQPASLLATLVTTLLLSAQAPGVAARGVVGLVKPRAYYCTNSKTVVEGNSCESIADKRCAISVSRFKSLNPSLDCDNLRLGQYFCCNEGAVPRNPECTNSKTVVAGNTCESIADKRCTISASQFKAFNPQLDCSNLKAGQPFCCNAGSVPLSTCTNVKTVVDGNTCANIAAQRCTISQDKLEQYNPHINCETLEIGEKVCCMEGKVPFPQPNADGTCADRQVVSGDSCATLVEKCGIAPSKLKAYNPASTFCSGLKINQWICCSSGKLKDRRPKPNADGSCATYVVKDGDTCGNIEAAYGMSEGELDSFNKKKTWGWAGCAQDQFWKDTIICLSSGTPPLPIPIDNAVCGPRKPGTVMPPAGTNISTLNPCPLNVCCNIWGQCGMTKEFCDIKGDGTPGTGVCINNCETGIVNNKSPPAQLRSIGYFEAWNPERPCLWMDITDFDQDRYTHIHFAFANVTSNLAVDVGSVQTQFNKFKTLRKSKRILSFGGWAQSTSKTTFQIFRDAVKPASRGILATNIANFVKEHGLDGVDIDWEYPAAPDIPGIPRGDPIDGPNYLAFLKLLRAALPAGKELGIAAPASYWYLKGFPIKEMSAVVDYIVYMTYDLHGQWDHGNEWSQDGCKTGDCLRSHINMTETLSALAMVTKAGVPASKIIVGTSSYGRSFQMKDPNCRGPNCQFTGTANISYAVPGPCTRTRGYMADGEINEYISLHANAKRDGSLAKRAVSVETSYDKASRSNIAFIAGTAVFYMSPQEKAARSAMYVGLNLGGVVDWAPSQGSISATERVTNGARLKMAFSTVPGDTDPVDTPDSGDKWHDLMCTIEAETNRLMEKSKRWSGAKAADAWADATKAYDTREMDASSGDFSTWIAGYFGAQEKMECGTLLPASPCNVQEASCKDKSDLAPKDVGKLKRGPAGKMIVNSFVQLNMAMTNFYQTFQLAGLDVADMSTKFIDHFMKTSEDTFMKQIGWNVLTAVTGIIGGPVLGNVFRNVDLVDVGKEITLGVIASAKDKDTAEPSRDVSQATSLVNALNYTLDHWSRAVVAQSKLLFNGEEKSINLLTKSMANGALIEGGVPKGKATTKLLTAQDLKDKIKRALFLYMIPVAWAGHDDQKVALVRTGRNCGDLSRFTRVPADVAKEGEVCFDTKQYLLVSVKGLGRECQSSPGSPMCNVDVYNDLKEAPGREHVGDFGLSVQDIGTAALHTWKSNGEKNGGEYKTGDREFTEFYDEKNPDADKALELGLARLNVCDLEVALKNWDAAGFKKTEFYPC